MNPEAFLQLARILGRDEVYRRLGLDEGAAPAALTPSQLSALQRLAGERTADIVRALLEEATSCDDVIDRPSAMVYLEDRLSFLGELLTEEQKAEVRERYGEHVAQWS
ncbi:MAG: hypothetical protein HYS09_08680 [Chloroflexi bacterium]|nr:hypothetical protein [Chloroflexota bacterium]